MTTQLPGVLGDIVREADPQTPEALFYMSFCDGDRPKGTQFLGVCIVRAKSMSGALARSHDLKINPGGEVMIVECPPEYVAKADAKWLERLLSRAEVEEMDWELLGH